ncbi:unnamed protein product [Oikopleura dioica]|uniref:Fork-head domain-containing protein n=1 Tax=Oikopleura dioica TaxID=34765 RepID=E4YU46_OIKDI|nr:unnamed protein product [Oikopleura dioica]
MTSLMNLTLEDLMPELRPVTDQVCTNSSDNSANDSFLAELFDTPSFDFLELDKQEITKEPQNDVFDEIKNVEMSEDFIRKETKPNNIKFCSSRPGTFRGIPMTYYELIETALINSENGKLTLKEIYDWLVKNVAEFHEGNSKKWQNSIRHNLSLHRSRFKRELNSEEGKSSFWSLNIARCFENEEEVAIDNNDSKGLSI